MRRGLCVRDTATRKVGRSRRRTRETRAECLGGGPFRRTVSQWGGRRCRVMAIWGQVPRRRMVP
jgi:hypothetical protein